MIKPLRPRIARGIEAAVRKADKAGEMDAGCLRAQHAHAESSHSLVLVDALSEFPYYFCICACCKRIVWLREFFGDDSRFTIHDSRLTTHD